MELSRIIRYLEKLQTYTDEYDNCYYKDKCKDRCPHSKEKGKRVICQYWQIEKLIKVFEKENKNKKEEENVK